jgi:hypothetical protein
MARKRRKPSHIQVVAYGEPGTGKTVFIDKSGEFMGQKLICHACNTWTWQDSRGHTRCNCKRSK